MPSPIIGFPSRYSEFEVQAEVYHKLKAQGVRVRGEVVAWTDDDGPHRCRMDLVVYDALERAVAIIECKNQQDDGNGSVIFKKSCRQGRRYHSFGLPVFQCVCWNQVSLTVSAVLEFLEEAMSA